MPAEQKEALQSPVPRAPTEIVHGQGKYAEGKHVLRTDTFKTKRSHTATHSATNGAEEVQRCSTYRLGYHAKP